MITYSLGWDIDGLEICRSIGLYGHHGNGCFWLYRINSLGPGRAKLIQKGMIYSPTHGDLAFTVPLFDEFMLRAMPKL
jgi:hypothetical protein